MKRGNVLVIGNYGSGKTTLIKSILGDSITEDYFGKSGKPEALTIYSSEEIPIRMIEAVEFDTSSKKTNDTVNSIKKWIKEDSKVNETDSQIDVIWFCVDGMNKRFHEDFAELIKVANHWGDVPVVVVITQSYGLFDRERNIDSVYNTFAKMKKNTVNLKKVVAVVADNYIFNETAIAPQEGITEIIELTNAIMPEESQIDESSIFKVKLMKMRLAAQGTVAGATLLASGSGIMNGVADKFILTKMMNNIMRNYGLDNNEEAQKLSTQIIEISTVGEIAKFITKLIDKFESRANAVISGALTCAIGESAIYMFEQIITDKDMTFNVENIVAVIEKYLSAEMIEKILDAAKNFADKVDLKKLTQIITETLKKNKK